HGNVEMMRDPETGEPHTSHTVGPVDLVYVGQRAGATLRRGGALRDLAPTMLDLLGVPKPAEMTGDSLLACAPPRPARAAAPRPAARACRRPWPRCCWRWPPWP